MTTPLRDFRRMRIERSLRTDVVAHVNDNLELIDTIQEKFNIEPYYMKRVSDGKTLLFAMDRESVSSLANLRQILDME